jgi:hypothetical protein
MKKGEKYKCAQCGKLWKQKDIDLKEFQEWNKREREKSWQELHPGGPRGKRKSREKVRRLNKEACKKWYQKNKEKILARKREEKWASEKIENEKLKKPETSEFEGDKTLEQNSSDEKDKTDIEK